MIREAFPYVKQIGHVLPAREDIKTGGIFVKGEKKENNFVLGLVTYV